ncbi:MAG TPA: glycosyltransferase family 87 protein [Methylophilaceae bacterium]|nr:glycosyltransferase family 87 protein [Methylophilaceae bacterium]
MVKKNTKVATFSTRRLAFIGVITILIPVLVSLSLGLTGHHSMLGSFHAFLTFRTGGDSWGPMEKALQYLASHPDGHLYEKLFVIDKIKFQYPPTSLLFHKIFYFMGLSPTLTLLTAINWIAICINALAVVAIGLTLGNQADMRGNKKVLISLLLLSTVFVSYPAMGAFNIGQIQVWINTLFAITCLTWIKQRKAWAGCLIGVICLIKPQFSLFLLWGLLRREKQFVIGGLLTAGAGLLASIMLFGLHNHIEYIEVLRKLSKTGECFWPNQSMNGILNRWVDLSCGVPWQAHAYPQYNPIVYFGTLLSSAALILGALFFAGGQQKGSLLDFQIASLSFTMASPIAWVHHYGILPAIYIAAFYAISRMADNQAAKQCMVFLAISYLLTSNYVMLADDLNGSVFNIGDSYIYFGALILLGTLYYLQRQNPAHSATQKSMENLNVQELYSS